MSSRTCQECGATIKRLDARFCEFCGSELPRPVTPAPASPLGDLSARFAALAAHPKLPRHLRHAPSTLGFQAQNFAGVAFSVVFLLIAFVVLAGFMRTASGPLALVPLFVVVVGVVMLLKTLGRAGSLASGDLERIPAVVVDERSETRGGSNSPGHTTWYVCVQTADGQREEYEAQGRLAGKLTKGDIGLAFVKAGMLLDFRRVPV